MITLLLLCEWPRLFSSRFVFTVDAALQKKNYEIISSFGDTVMEIVCRDCCDGHDVTRVSFTPSSNESREALGKLLGNTVGELLFPISMFCHVS